ncbi:hypothetical protein [Fodinibius halophilus]|uniref:LPS export ABC transporter periplasmic protein LptC n=1 Tax=Fodinibius halophilus TaxID=1736908 RepID=A0A6M1TDH2_9BACT|nr:hypothetical protein [Fodinibius halophilus]NGP90061.1 hypothetical protein [Fodinibius halophilus]
MMNINVSVLLIIALTIAGCSTSSNSQMVRETDIRIVFENSDGDNLLSGNTSNTITEQNTDLYYLNNGKKEKIFNGNHDYPKQFYITDESREHEMILFPHIKSDQDTARTLIKAGTFAMDTLKVEYEHSQNVIAVHQLWYNGELKWDTNEQTDRKIVVTKSSPESN